MTRHEAVSLVRDGFGYPWRCLSCNHVALCIAKPRVVDCAVSKFKRPIYAPAGALPLVAANVATVAAKALATDVPAALAVSSLAQSARGTASIASSTSLVAQEPDPRDNPAQFAGLLRTPNPANPLALVAVIQGRSSAPVADPQALIASVLRAPLSVLLADPRSLLYVNPAESAVMHAVVPSGANLAGSVAPAGAVFDKSAPTVVGAETLKSKLAALPNIVVKEGDAYKPTSPPLPPRPVGPPPPTSGGRPTGPAPSVPRSVALSALIAGGVDCGAWNAMSEEARRNTLVNFGLATAKTANDVMQGVNSECASPVAASPNTTPSNQALVAAARATMNGDHVTCAQWLGWTPAQRTAYLTDRPHSATIDQSWLAQLVTLQCNAEGGLSAPPQPQRAMTVGQATLNSLFSLGATTGVYSCTVWQNFSPEAKRAALRVVQVSRDSERGAQTGGRVTFSFGIPAAPAAPEATDAELDALAADVTYECMRMSEDWRAFFRYLPPPSNEPSRSLRSCAGFLSATRAQQVEGFVRRGWREVDIPDGIARIQAWCAQTTNITGAIAGLCATTNWRVRDDLIAATRRVMRPLTLEASPQWQRAGTYQAQVESNWEQGASDALNIPSLPVLCQDVFDHCDGSGAGTAFTQNRPQFADNRDYHRAWLSVGPILPAGGFDALDPVQGATGDCYLIAAMSALAWCRPGLLEGLVQRVGAGPQGTTHYRVRIRGEWQEVDDTFTMSPYWFVPLYARGVRPDAQWPALIEKAYAKWRTRDATGRPSVAANNALYFGGDVREDARRPVAAGIAHVEFPHADLAGGETFWWLTWFRRGDECRQKLARYCDATGRAVQPMSASTYPTAEQQGIIAGLVLPSGSIELGFVPGHAYSILGVTTDSEEPAIILRNPWGHGTPDRSVLAPGLRQWQRLNVTGDYNGVFAIKPSEFARYFGAVYGSVL